VKRAMEERKAGTLRRRAIGKEGDQPQAGDCDRLSEARRAAAKVPRRERAAAGAVRARRKSSVSTGLCARRGAVFVAILCAPSRQCAGSRLRCRARPVPPAAQPDQRQLPDDERGHEHTGSRPQQDRGPREMVAVRGNESAGRPPA